MTNFDSHFTTERRRYPRKPVYEPVYVYYGDETIEAKIYNISEKGLYVGTRKGLEIGRKISLAYSISEADPRINEPRAEIVRLDTKGFAAEFIEELVSDNDTDE